MDSEDIGGWNKESQRAWDNDPHIQPIPEEVATILKEFLPPKAHILDVGCGIGKHIHGFRSLGYLCDGIDQSEVAVKYAKITNPKAEIRHIRIQQLEEINKFDMIHTSAVLQHNKHERKKTILKIFRRALKPNGFLLMTENTLNKENIGCHYLLKEGIFHQLEYNENVTDGYSFTVSGWIRFMKENGFEIVEVIMPYPYYLFRGFQK